VGVVAGNQYEISDRFDELKVVRIPFKTAGNCWKLDVPHGLPLSTGSLFHGGRFVSKLAYVRKARNYELK
jgi:hypothetical protein